MQIPTSDRIPVKRLAACFNNTSATYKFYWFLSIIQSVELGHYKIPKRILFARMIANAWYTVNYFHVSFGSQDKLQSAIEAIINFEPLTIDDDREKIFQTLTNSVNRLTLSQLKFFNNQVPHWFLSPWFPGVNKNEIYKSSQEYKGECLYALFDDCIIVNTKWTEYLEENIRVLKDFCYWNLTLFLQSKNPNVPDISNKLIKPATRNNLTKQRKQFWDIVINECGSVKCIYTGNDLTIGNYAVEHFIPYNFVSHDLIWNLIPADKSFNCTKSDNLPPLDKYFDSFFCLQKMAIDIVKHANPRNKFLEDYLTIFTDLNEISELPINFTREKFKERIQPIITIASNNGFDFMK